MKTNRIRILIPLGILAVAGLGFIAHTGFGTLSAFGWEDISLLCPLGALGTMLASKTIIPRAIVSLVVAVIAIIILGRAFCGWICPVPVLSKLRGLLKRQGSTTKEASSPIDISTPLSPDETKTLKEACRSCHADRPVSSRHLILGGSLLSAAIFGFPVFCLICPIGLSFAFVFVLINLFGKGDITWSVIAIPVLLLIEVVFFRTWCSRLCPLSSLMSLVGKANHTFRPTIDDTRCLETAHGITCGRCADVCESAIDPRHPERGASWSECTKCRACVESCPGAAIGMPFLPQSRKRKRETSNQALEDIPLADGETSASVKGYNRP